MEYDELKDILVLDIPKPSKDFNRILNACKESKMKNKLMPKMFLMLSTFCVIFVIIMSTILILKNNNKKLVDETGKIKIISSQTSSSGEMINGPDDFVSSWYGIVVYIFCDYSKHPKYSEWIEKYGLKGVYDGEESVERQKYVDRSAEYDNNYYYLLNSECYELIKDGFPTSNTFYPDGLCEWIQLTYSTRWDDKEFDPYETMEQALENLKNIKENFYNSKDYSSLFELAKEDYVIRIEIVEYEPYDGRE